MTVPCLTTLKSNVYFKTNPGIGWHDNPFKLIGYNDHDVYPSPYRQLTYTFIEVGFKTKYVKPQKLMLIGTRTYEWNHLRSWKLEGRDSSKKLHLLYNCTGCYLSHNQEANFTINSKRTFKSFKITMLETNNNGLWAMCLGQIELFGSFFGRTFDCMYVNSNKLKRIYYMLLVVFLVKT